MNTEQLRELVEEIIRSNVVRTVINGNFTVILNEGDSTTQILQLLREAGLAFVGDIAYRLPNRYSPAIKVDDAYAQGFKDAQDKLFKAGYRQTEEIEL